MSNNTLEHLNLSPSSSSSRDFPSHDSGSNFSDAPILDYLRLESGHEPLPSADPLAFLQQHQHLKRLPPHLLSSFATVTTPKQRTIIAAIRNRRLNYANSQPPELEFDNARDAWPDLWQGQERRRVEQRENRDEKAWAESHFLDGRKQHVGKLGSLLGDYAEERAAERVRTSRRRTAEEFVPEEEDSEDSEDNDEASNGNVPDDSPEESRANFERLIREHFIYGLLDTITYDAVDWSDRWDLDNDRIDEERWFDEEEESI